MAKAELPKDLPVNPYEKLTVEPDSEALRALEIPNDDALAEVVAEHAKKSKRIDKRIVVLKAPAPEISTSGDAIPLARTHPMPLPKDPNDTLLGKMRSASGGNLARVVVATLATSVLIGAGVAYETMGPNEAAAASGSAEHRAVQNPDKLRAIGLCANELTAQAEFNQRADVKSSIGFSADDYYNAARFAAANNVPCSPDRSAVVSGSDEDMKAVRAENISAFDADTVCDQLTVAERGGAGGGSTIVAAIDRSIIADLQLDCR